MPAPVRPFVLLQRSPTGHILVEGLAPSGRTGRFIVDTAAARSVISRSSPHFAEASARSGPVEARGSAGSVSAEKIVLTRFSIGETVLAPMEFVGLDLDPIGEKIGVPCDGILGLDVLLRGGFWLDLKDESLLLAFPAPPPNSEAVDFRRTRDGLVILDAAVDDRLVAAVLDTGAARTVANSKAGEIMRSAAQEPGIEVLRALGIGGAPTAVSQVRPRSFRIGSAQISLEALLVAQFPIFERFAADTEAILLGLNALEGRVIGIEAQGSTLWLSTR